MKTEARVRWGRYRRAAACALGTWLLFLAASTAIAHCPRARSSTDQPGATSAAHTAFESRTTVTIPAQTEVATELLSGIHSRVSHVGDSIIVRLREPVYVDGHMALPSGTLLDGHITRIRASGRMHRPAELALRFDRVALPDGEDKPVRGVLASLDLPKTTPTRLDAEGYLKGGPAFSRKSAGGATAAVASLTAFKVAVGGSMLLGAMLPAGGAALATYTLVWRRGSDVHLPPETRCRVRLVYPLTVRVQW